jgi:hypothetical protein
MGENVKWCFNAKKNEWRNTTPVNNAITSEASVPSREIQLSPWNYKVRNLHYHKMCN